MSRNICSCLLSLSFVESFFLRRTCRHIYISPVRCSDPFLPKHEVQVVSLDKEPYAVELPPDAFPITPALPVAPPKSVPLRSVLDAAASLFGENTPPIIIDARSPDEFSADHITGAFNIPVISNAERAEVGKIFNSGSTLEARIRGASFVCANIATSLRNTDSDDSLSRILRSYIHEETTITNAATVSITPTFPRRSPPFILVYCWRGGQRSRALATIISEIGWPGGVGYLFGGYRSWRRLILRQLEAWPLHDISSPLWVLASLTGCGKTLLLEELEASGESVVHLERMADHKGSVFGKRLSPSSVLTGVTLRGPSQRQFESRLHACLTKLLDPSAVPRIWTECESRSVGPLCMLPNGFWHRLRDTKSRKTFRIWLDVPEDARISWILEDYADWLQDSETLHLILKSISAYHGDGVLEKWLRLVSGGDFPGLVASLFRLHYDPLYKKSRGKMLQEYAREGLLYRIPMEAVSSELIRRDVLPILLELTSGPSLRFRASSGPF